MSAVNPFVEEIRRVSVVRLQCQACRDFGYVLPPDVEVQYPGQIPAGVLYREALKCVCRSGDDFQREQADFRAPMPTERPAPKMQASSPGTDGDRRPLTVADLDPALFAPKPKPAPKPILRRITAADFEALKGKVHAKS